MILIVSSIKYFYNARKENKYGAYSIFTRDSLCRTLTTKTGYSDLPKVIEKEGNKLSIRKLTPLECWRLQGFPDELFYKAQEVNSNSQLYKQAGNGVSVPVIEWIAKRLQLDNQKELNFLDVFAGVGGFRLGMQRAGHKPIGYIEIDKYARKSYENMYDTKGEFTANDIKSITNEQIKDIQRKQGPINVICGGFPCQTFSMAGKRMGFKDDTKGTLFFEIARIAEQIKPQFLFLENVKGLLNHDKGQTFRTILSTLDELGYDVEWNLFNSKDFGVPQSRERVFIIGHLRTERTREVFY